MTRDGELPARAYIDLVLSGLPTETDMTATTTLLNQARTAASAYTAPELREEQNRRLVAGLARLLRDSEPGSDKQVLVAKALIGSADSDDAAALIEGWLAGDEVPAGLEIDTAMRWAIVKSLASLGKLSADDIEREKSEHDDTSAGAEQAAGARAALPTAPDKELAWKRATDEPDIPNETHRQVCAGFWQYGQDVDYTDRYLELLDAVSTRAGSWAERGYAAIAAAVKWLFPMPVATREVVERIQQWVRDNDPAQQVLRLVLEQLDDAERALRAQETSRQ